MTFVLFYAETLHVFKEFHATNLNEASSYVLENLSDFLTFKRTCDKCLCISYLNKSGKYSICSFIYISDFHVSHFIDVNSVPDDAFVEDINTADQGESVDVENTSASEQDNTVDKRTCETCKYRNIYFRCDCHSSHLFNRDLKYDYSCIFYVNKNHYDDVFRSGG